MDFESGLTIKEVVKKRRRYGLNLLENGHKLKWQSLLFDQFKSPLIYILMGAGVVSAILKEGTDTIVIMAAVALNAGLGFFQEYKAESALEALKNMIVAKIEVIRGGKQQIIKSEELVPGDVVLLKPGDKVPADGLLLETNDLQISEAILTGEAEAITKRAITKNKKKTVEKRISLKGWNKKNIVWAGTVVLGGKGTMIVVKTGMKSRMGRLAKKLKSIENEETPLRAKVNKMAKIMTITVGGICLFILAEGILMGRQWGEMLILAVAVAVASIPEGLAISMTVILTLGMERISKQKGLVRKLLAAETLGSVEVICVDKTGTLTEGKMKVSQTKLSEEAEVMADLACCNPMINSIDRALADWGREMIFGKKKMDCGKTKIEEIPFDSDKKQTVVLCKNKQEVVLYAYGAPEKIIETTNLGEKERKDWLKKLDGFSQQGLRVIGIARKKGEEKEIRKIFEKLKKKEAAKNLEWQGLIMIEDPIRKEVKGALKLARRAGIKIKVITGDYQYTAMKVLSELRLVKNLKENKIMSGDELAKISEEELEKRVDKIVLFYRTKPEQKIRIVRALQNGNRVVAMVGDGVNDSLALKKADMGVVVNEATEVAKETADMVLLDSNFSTMITAIKEGRIIFENIRKVILYLLSGSFSEVVLVLGSLLLGLPIPFLPAQILWINMVEDSLPGLALAFEKDDDGLMQKKPRSKNTPLISKKMYWMIGAIALVTDVILFFVYDYLIESGAEIKLARTIVFAILGIDSLLFSFACKSLNKNLWQIKVFGNWYLNGSFGVGMILLLAGIYLPVGQKLLQTVPLDGLTWVWIMMFGIMDLALIELLKAGLRIKNVSKLQSNF